jgi:hypothetical protein
MRRNTMKHLLLPGAAALLALGLLSGRAAAAPCADVFEQLYPENAPHRVRFVRGEPQNDISYGLEAEFNIQNAPGLLEWYRPSSHTDAQWFAMSIEQRKASLNGGSGSYMVKTSRAPEWLTDSLSSDPGGAELITKVTNKLEEALSWVRQVETQAGGDGGTRSKAFYWQGNVAFKHDGAFARQNRDGLEGYVRATGDYAQFGKLHTGYEQHQRDPSFIPAKNLGHSVLGPINTQKMADMVRELDASARGENLSGFGHYIQGTYFRTWPYGPGRSGMEVRDAHKDVYVLRRELRRLTHGLENGFEAFAPLKTISVLDETAHFNQLSPAVQQMLRGLPGFGSYAARFALPMKPYENEYPQALAMSGPEAEQFRSRVTAARAAYVQTLEGIAGNSGLSPEQKADQARIAIAKFAYDSGIYTTLDSFFARTAGATAARPAATDAAPDPRPAHREAAGTPARDGFMSRVLRGLGLNQR